MSIQVQILSITDACRLINAGCNEDSRTRFYPSGIRRLVAAGRFPPPIPINLGPAGCEGFWKDEVERWIAAASARATRSHGKQLPKPLTSGSRAKASAVAV
jgi:predicted DNA-binding transcriptional regulator AlpA